MKIRAQNKAWYNGISIAMFKEINGKIFCQKKLYLEEIKEGDELPELITIEQHEAQLLMDDLWHCGIRPSEGSGSSGQLAATQKHLDDMRKITFHKLDMEVKV